ncbi:MAG: ribokinase [Gammaproteobacteria bacterium]
MNPPKVFVIGNCTVDLFFRLRRFPGPGETLLADEHLEDFGGKGANQAMVAARSGVPVCFATAVGKDAAGAGFRARLEREGLALDHVRQLGPSTDKSVIHVSLDGENCIVSSHAAAARLGIEEVADLLAVIGDADFLLMQGNLSSELTRHCLERGRSRGATTLLNPAPINYSFERIWPIASTVVLNVVEVQALTRKSDAAAGARQLNAAGVERVIVTLGAAGVLSITSDEVLEIPPVSVKAVDTTGAGDVFCGTYVAGLALGHDPTVCLQAANEAAALSVTRAGTQSAFPSKDELAGIWRKLG